uniref:Uncharacterized protein n=1 Tax=uncultured Thiotrichaceae bacterium TaxID=298394 RepID=A0A6S6U8S1_9GAMM|nr:MAG: Unknown protein [uncultured Thiotrichaceae bacterium]
MNDNNQQQIIYYWPNGYWIDDQKEAALLDSVNAFGAVHMVLEVPFGEDVKAAVKAELESLVVSSK